MSFFFYFLGVLLLICVIGHYSVEFYKSIKSVKRFEDDKSEFMSDLYNTQHKWLKRGKVDYALALDVVIKGFNLEEEEDEPSTLNARTIKRMMTNNE